MSPDLALASQTAGTRVTQSPGYRLAKGQLDATHASYRRGSNRPMSCSIERSEQVQLLVHTPAWALSFYGARIAPGPGDKNAKAPPTLPYPPCVLWLCNEARDHAWSVSCSGVAHTEASDPCWRGKSRA